MRTERVNLPSEGAKFYDAVAAGPIGAEAINGELATATVSQTNKRSPAFPGYAQCHRVQNCQKAPANSWCLDLQTS